MDGLAESAAAINPMFSQRRFSLTNVVVIVLVLGLILNSTISFELLS